MLRMESEMSEKKRREATELFNKAMDEGLSLSVAVFQEVDGKEEIDIVGNASTDQLMFLVESITSIIEERLAERKSDLVTAMQAIFGGAVVVVDENTDFEETLLGIQKNSRITNISERK